DFVDARRNGCGAGDVERRQVLRCGERRACVDANVDGEVGAAEARVGREGVDAGVDVERVGVVGVRAAVEEQWRSGGGGEGEDVVAVAAVDGGGGAGRIDVDRICS